MTTSNPDHPTDGTLLALHDGERGAELDAPRQHVSSCAACQTRMAEIASNAAQVRQSLSSLPVPSFDADTMRRRLAARRATPAIPLWRRPTMLAAAAVFVVAVVAAASPVRRWIEARVARPTPVFAPPSATVPEASPPQVSGATVSFAVAGPEFTIRLDSVPAAGVLTVVRAAGNELSARVAAGAGTGGDDMVVLPNELRLRNAASSRASYRVAVPSVVVRVRVIVAGQIIFEGAAPTEVKLTR